MYFNRIAHPANFAFATEGDPASGTLRIEGEPYRLVATDLGGDVHRIVVEHRSLPPTYSQAELESSVPGESSHRLTIAGDGTLAIAGAAAGVDDPGCTGNGNGGDPILSGVPGATFGVCGGAWVLQFRHHGGMQFYGLGEHSKGIEKSGQRVKFWNTDLFGDFAHCEIRDGHVAPMYVAMPWLIVKQGNRYAGILVNNPGAVFMDLASNFVWHSKNGDDRSHASFFLGAPGGRPELYAIVGPTLSELIRKLQTLVGRTPLPPLWALGHHQSRWGYAGPRDLAEIDEGFRAHGIPCDGLWLDIDYMDRYKVFTFSPEHWPSRKGIEKFLKALRRRGRRVVTILDPGVKAEEGYDVRDEALGVGAFCVNPTGRPFVGFAWPGKIHLPDFSLPEGRAWWASRVRKFVETGIAGAWLDMNDPSLGPVEPEGMLFARGTEPHAAYHNQYALGMARASRAGLLAARPDERPFLLSRSAFLSSSRHTAVWTGDNVSNWHHLRQSIPLSIGLALSGLPFNGPDVCGFMGDTTPKLALAWYKACFLFPFLRNHTSSDTRPQEPWNLGPAAPGIARCIRLRYKLLPYLYQLFVEQEQTGDAILRPLFYDFADTPELPLGAIDDQFLIGPSILQAPIIRERAAGRNLVLPGAGRWFSAQDGRWLAGGVTIRARAPGAETPLYVREGAILPMQPGERTDNRNDLSKVELHCFLRRDSVAPARLRYVFDDGKSFAYQRGERSSFIVEAAAGPDGTLEVAVRDLVCGCGPARIRVVVYDRFLAVRLAANGGARDLALSLEKWKFTGRPLAAFATPWIPLRAAREAKAP